VIFEDEGFELCDGAPDGIGLLEHVNAVLVFFNHASYALQVAVDVIETAQ
jgi:hypothetical protein